MSNLDRRKLLHLGIAAAIPLGSISLLSGCQQSTDDAKKEDPKQANSTDPDKAQKNPDKTDPKSKEENMQIQYLEIVTPEVEALCKQYEAIHGITFSEPVAGYGNARTAKLGGGGLIGIRGPMRESETPVVRPYTLVKDLKESVAKATEAGAEVAIPSMELPGHGTIAVVILGGIECGFWQL